MQRSTYLTYIRALLVGLLLLAGWLSLQLWQTERQEQALFRLTVSAPSAQTGTSAASGLFRRTGRFETFSAEILEQMDAFPGLRRRWALYGADVELCIDRYHADTELYGAALSEYPLTILKSAGERRTGMQPLLIAGQDFLGSLSDEYGNLISERQTKILKEQIDSLAVRLAVRGGVDTEIDNAIGNGGTGNMSGDRGDRRFQDAKFLGIVEEDGLYMDADQMRRWLAQLGLPCEIRRVILEIQGGQNAQKAQKSLEKAGFHVERRTAGI